MIKLPFSLDLTGKVVVITGAGGVLCSVFAKALAKTNAKIALLDLNGAAAEQCAKEIQNDGGCAKAYSCSVLDQAQLRAVHDAILSDLGSCDFLINGAGGNHPKATTEDEYFSMQDRDSKKTFFDLDKDGVEFVFSLNFLGTLLPTQVFAADMLQKEDAAIINISSMNADRPLTKIPAYSGAKAAVSNLTQWLAVYFSGTKIRCNAIAPGFFLTKQNESLLKDASGALTPRSKKILSGTPMGRFGSAEELLGALFFLLSKRASGFVTGTVIPVDGGFSAYSGV